MMERSFLFFLISVFLPVFIGSTCEAQVPIRFYEDCIPAYRWTGNTPVGDTSLLFMPDRGKVTEVRLIPQPDSVHLYSTDHSRISAMRNDISVQKMAEAFRKADSVYFPPMFGIYLYREDGKFGLMTEDGTGVAAPDYDKIYVLYQYLDFVRSWVLSPVFMVYRNRQYALMDANGFVVTRYCKDPGQLPGAYLITESDMFRIDQRIPTEYWGY